MKLFLLLVSFFCVSCFPVASFAQSFSYQCGKYQLRINLSPNAAFLDDKPYTYQNGESNGETTKMTFYGDNGDVLKFLVNPALNFYRMGLTSGSNYSEEDCKEI